MNKILITAMTFLLSFQAIAQEYQTYLLAGLKIKKEYKIKINTVLLEMAKQNNINNLLTAYVGAENEESPTKGVIYNINVYDESSLVSNQTNNQISASKRYLNGITQGLKTVGYQYTEIIYQGVPAVEYTYDMHGVPSRTLCFLKGKKAYIIQVTTGNSLSSQFDRFKNSIIIN